MNKGALEEESAWLRAMPAPQHANTQRASPRTAAAPATQCSAPATPAMTSSRGAPRGKLVRAKWLDGWGKNGMRSRLVAQQFNWAKRDDVTQNTPPLVAARLLLSKASSFGREVGPESRYLAVWDCSVAFNHAPLVARRKVCAPWVRLAAPAGHERHEEGELCVVTEEFGAMPAVPFANVVVAPMAMIVHGDDFFADGRAEALLSVDEYLRNKSWINLVSFAGPRHEKDIKFLKRVGFAFAPPILFTR